MVEVMQVTKMASETRVTAGLLFLLFLCGCTDLQSRKPLNMDKNVEVKSHPWHEQIHHNGSKGFKNIWDRPREVPVFKAARWMISHLFADKNNVPPPVRTIDPEYLRRAPDRLRVTWLGHSAALIQTPAFNLLTDPMLTNRASPFSFAGPQRLVDVPIEIKDLPAIDAVLISHDHYDHLDEKSIRALQAQFSPMFIVPLGIGTIIKDWGGSRVLEMDWWQYVNFGGLRIHCTPAKHFSGRGLTGRDGNLWASWYIEDLESDLRVYYGGDTGYASHFEEIAAHLGSPEVALLPIGAYLPRWFMSPVHVNPEEAVQAFIDLGARHFVPLHWGTFDLAEETVQLPARQVREAAARSGHSDKLHLLDIGESFSLDGAKYEPPASRSNT